MKSLSLFIISLATFHCIAEAKLKQPELAQGTADVEMVDENHYLITLSDDAFIFWDDFCIDEGESVVFSQPSSQSMAIIEVIGNQVSSLLGNLKSNGNIFIVNSHGIVVGENAYIDSYGFFASALPTCPCPLFNGEQDIFMQGDTRTSVINKGRIKAWENHIYLLGYQVHNSGVIDAARGTVAIAAGRDLVLHPSNGHKIGVFPSSLKTENEDTGIDNSGVIIANRVELKADGNAYGIGIRHYGLLDNTGIPGSLAETFLAVEKGSTVITGVISSENSDGSGGNVHILGEQIFLFENSSVDASGDNKGGNIWIGAVNDGTYPNPTETKWIFIDEETSILADAIEDGNGGKIVIRSEGCACVHGAASVSGGENSGNGGTIEIYAKNNLEFQGETDIMAPKGKKGLISIFYGSGEQPK